MADQSAPAAPIPGSTDQNPASPVHPLQAELIPAELPEDNEDDDNDSALGVNDALSSTASVASSVLHYRTIQGRTYHSERYNTEYIMPNDDRQSESIDITHHYLTLLLGGKLFLAPIKDDIQKALDVGTGTGIWAIDFADQFTNTEVIGMDLSPTQPTWVPPNLKFELDDATQTWSWPDSTFDFVHIRYLFGGIADWNALFKQAYRCCKPGGWVQSCEADASVSSDDGTADGIPAIKTLNTLIKEGGKKFGRSLCVLEEDLQKKGFEAAGFVDIQEVNFKVPASGWPQDPKIREVGQFVKLALENDLEGYTLMLWKNVLNWPEEEFQVFLMGMRNVLKNKRIHGYFKVRYVYGRKPADGMA
ncbi:S-adenosyl-L-methionine-dependent methyltransferase [Phialemonium atrogriseum]|uniref:S-adenosyl-L-methionine-dependent methyltransferase n=1 Tax=Phialemonium atrogriseum TaxID=1093897 RepID=A0AAJ0C8E4_9PEZI|nr:S-adenosyl-L-methionine-dependent methyltransferase [Phialemonium atrogriseum]KAK1772059.1 S-adenosyl-L-methionine-dependent methyltransferase [Phialemonium atrogriseum]